MTPAEAIAILEIVKDLTNENGKRELTVVQRVIREWEPFLSDPAELLPVLDEAPAIEKFSEKVEEPEEKPWAPKNVRQTPKPKPKKKK